MYDVAFHCPQTYLNEASSGHRLFPSPCPILAKKNVLNVAIIHKHVSE